MAWFLVISAIVVALAFFVIAPILWVQRALFLFEPASEEEQQRRREDGPRLELIQSPDLSAFAGRAHT